MGTPKDPELRILLHPHGNHTSTDSLTRFLCPPISQWNFELPEKLAIFWLNYIHLEVSKPDRILSHSPAKVPQELYAVY